MKKIKKLLDVILKIIKNYNAINYTDFVLVYTIGKVGSTSIGDSIKNSVVLHSLNGEPNKYFSAKYQSSFLLRILNYLKWIFYIKKTKKIIKKKKDNNDKIKIITGIRDPIARNISAFFQSLSEGNNNNTSNNVLIEEFFLFANHFTPLYWFEREIRHHFNINIYNHKFNKSKGYSIIEKNGVEIFLYRLDKLDELEKEIGKFLDSKNFELKYKNKSNQKWYSEKYYAFKREIKFKESFLNLIYNDDRISYFYTKSEIINFKSKWAN